MTPNQKLKYQLSLDISIELIRLRNRYEMTVSELAKLAGVKPETINKIENGDRIPNLITLAKIASALGNKIEIGFGSE